MRSRTFASAVLCAATVVAVSRAGAQTPLPRPKLTKPLPHAVVLNLKLPRLKALRTKTLPPMSRMRLQPISLGTGHGGTTLSRRKLAAAKTPSTPHNEDDVAAGRYCTTRDVSEQNGEYSKIVLGNQSDKIYPGALYGDTAILDGSYNAPPGLHRRPYEIATSLFSAASTGPSHVRVEPTIGAVNDGIAQLMRNNAHVVNASDVSVDVSQIYSLDQLAFELQAGYQGYGVDLAAEFSYNKQSEKHVILAKLTQVYFSVVLNDPNGASLVESSGPLPANALYVNKVNYGRLGILKIETSYSAEEIQAALDFHYSQGAQSAHAAANVDYDKIFSDIEINGFFFGGDSANGMVPINCTRETCASKLDEFNRYVRDGLRLDTMVAPTPISYELKYLNDNATAFVNSTTSYVERNCQPGQGVAVRLDGISIENVHRAWDGAVCPTATCDSDCGYAWGSVKVELDQREHGITVKTVPAILNGRPSTSSTIWQRSATDPQRGITNYKVIADRTADSIDDVGKTFQYQLDPRVYAAGGYVLKVTTDIKTNHKDNHLAMLGFHGMKHPVVREIPLKDALYDPGQADKEKYGSWIVGPFSSESNRLHSFRAHFTVKPIQ